MEGQTVLHWQTHPRCAQGARTCQWLQSTVKLPALASWPTAVQHLSGLVVLLQQGL
jgi:hypothetical protein